MVTVDRRFPFRPVAVAAAFASAGIHLFLAPDHLAEKFYIGVLFLIGSALLGVAMIGLSTDREAIRVPAWVLGGAVSAGMFVGFVLSRTTGLPLGYREGWLHTYEDVLGLVSLALELIVVACAAASLARRRRGTGGSALALPRQAPAPLR